MAKERSAAEAEFYVNREKWIEAVFEDSRVNHAEFRVLFFIAKRSNADKGGSYWSVKRIAEVCRCSTKTVSEATMKASRNGLLKITRTVGQKNFYQPTFFGSRSRSQYVGSHVVTTHEYVKPIGKGLLSYWFLL